MENDKLKFDEIYTSFRPKIYRYLMRLIGDQEAEDLTQEVFIKVDKGLKVFRNESQLSTWIYRIATNTAIDRMRNASVRCQLTKKHGDYCVVKADSTEFAEKDTGLSIKTSSIEERVIHKEMNECIRGVIDNLPENYRTVVILSELEGLQNKEIAEILELSLDVVKVRLHRGKARLKKELLNHCKFSWDERNELTCDPKDSI